MKKKLASLAVIASLALAGCSAGNQSADATPSTTSTPSASPIAEPAVLSEADVAKAKQKAIDSGRPENAWDKNCIAWTWPEPKTKGQEWANKLGNEWLQYRDVKCPDAIVYPFYDVTSFEAGKSGELVINYSGDPQWDGNAQVVSSDVMGALREVEDSLHTVTVRYEDGTEVSTK